jgi:small subunit ribosomal protein S7
MKKIFYLKYKVKKKQIFFYKTDPKNYSFFLLKFINKIMNHGKKIIAFKILYSSFKQIKYYIKKNPYKNFIKIIQKIKPIFVLKTAKIAGRKYLIPFNITKYQALKLSLNFFYKSIQKRTEYTFKNKIFNEFYDIFKKKIKTNSLKQKEDYITLCEENKTFLHFR